MTNALDFIVASYDDIVNQTPCFKCVEWDSNPYLIIVDSPF